MMKNLSETFSTRLTIARSHANLTQEELAQLSGVSLGSIKKIEGGESNVRLSTLENLANGLEIPPFYLLISEEVLKILTQLGLDLHDHIMKELYTKVDEAYLRYLDEIMLSLPDFRRNSEPMLAKIKNIVDRDFAHQLYRCAERKREEKEKTK